MVRRLKLQGGFVREFSISLSHHAFRRWNERVGVGDKNFIIEEIKTTKILKENDIPPFPFKRKENTTYATNGSVIFVCEGIEYRHYRVITVLTADNPHDDDVHTLGVQGSQALYYSTEIKAIIAKKAEVENKIAEMKRQGASSAQLDSFRTYARQLNTQLQSRKVAQSKALVKNLQDKFPNEPIMETAAEVLATADDPSETNKLLKSILAELVEIKLLLCFNAENK
jgi:hypothetical protein